MIAIDSTEGVIESKPFLSDFRNVIMRINSTSAEIAITTRLVNLFSTER